MTLLEFRNLKLNDPVLDCRGRLAKAYDIDRANGTVKTNAFGGSWRSFHKVKLVKPGETVRTD